MFIAVLSNNERERDLIHLLRWIRVCVIKKETILDGIIKCTCDGRENATLLNLKKPLKYKASKRGNKCERNEKGPSASAVFPHLHVIKILFYHRDIFRSICYFLFNYLCIMRVSIYFQSNGCRDSNEKVHETH